jgi:hypothetical protein
MKGYLLSFCSFRRMIHEGNLIDIVTEKVIESDFKLKKYRTYHCPPVSRNCLQKFQKKRLTAEINNTSVTFETSCLSYWLL